MQTVVVRVAERNKTAPNKVPAVQPSVFPGKCLRPRPLVSEYLHREIITSSRVHLKSSFFIAIAVAIHHHIYIASSGK